MAQQEWITSALDHDILLQSENAMMAAGNSSNMVWFDSIDRAVTKAKAEMGAEFQNQVGCVDSDYCASYA